MSSSQWVFGPFRLDPDHACLWCAGQAVVLPPKRFAVLHYLVTHPDRLVTKDELLEAVWPATAVNDAVVRVTIGALRKVLGDTAQAPRYIATISRHGYCFVVPVVAYPGEAPDTAVPSAALHTPIFQTRTGEVSDTREAPPWQRMARPPSALPPLATERRFLTVLCCDLVDATTFAGRFDPEDFREIIRAYHQTYAEVLRHFDGYIAQYLSEGVLVYFGYPEAHEDDAHRAVCAGLGLLDALAPLHTRLRLPPEAQVAMRVGVHTGLVVVGEVGEGARQEPLALGDVPHIAARLQQLAAPDTLVISAATYQLIEGYFTCEALGAQGLRGLTEPLRVYRVLGASGVQSRLEVAATRGLTPLVGRAPEVALLMERWARATAGMGQVVVLTGEAGIGKSRLVQVLKDHVASAAPMSLECRGVPYYQHTAWYPLIELFQHWLQWHPGEAPGAALAKLEILLAQASLALDEAVPLMAELLALPLPAERYPPRPLPSEQQRQRTLDLLLTLIVGLAAQQPVLVIVEDLHWVDPSTLELLALLIDQAPTLRLCLVLTGRPALHPPWGFRTHLTPLTLHRLTPPQAEAMVAGMRGGERLPAAVLAQIVEKTDGIPLFVEEVTKAVLEGDGLTDIADQATGGGPVPAIPIPATLHEALLARLDRLGSAKGVAQLGATIGRQFAYALLRAVSPLEEARLQRDLSTLVEAELLYQRGQPPRAIYTFKHALVQEAAYESVLQRVRRQTHQRIVQVLEAQFPETVVTAPERLAYHARRGELWDQAVTYFRQAGEQALARSAYREAVAACEQALETVQHLPESRDTLAHAIDLRLALRNALWPLGALGQILVYLQEAQGLAETLGEPYRLGWVMAYLAGHFAQICEPDQALASGHRALAIAADLEDVDLTVTAQHYLGMVYRGVGDYRQAIEFSYKNVTCLHGELLQERFRLQAPSPVSFRYSLVDCLAECGAFTEGIAPAAEGVRMAEAADYPYSRVQAYYAVGFRALRQGDLPQALPVLERALDLAQGAHLRLLLPWITAPLGAAYVLAGRTAEALPLLEQAIEQALAMQFLVDHALRVVWLGEAYLRAGRLAEADMQAQRALEFSRAHQERGHEAYALRLLGELATRHKPPVNASATAHYRQALTLADELAMRPLQAHCHRGLGTLYAATGQREQARTALSTAIEMYRDMEMTFWLPQTEAALAQVEGR